MDTDKADEADEADEADDIPPTVARVFGWLALVGIPIVALILLALIYID